jgi:mannose PTS system EIIA component
MIVLLRIDDRLIHGQVVEGWVNHLKATCLLVADDAASGNVLQRSIMELSAPQGLKAIIGTVEEACSRLRSGTLDAERIILLFSNPSDVLRALKAGLVCRALNIGGMHCAPGKRKLLDAFAVSAADAEAIRDIRLRGVKIEIQTVPTQRPQPIEKFLPPSDGELAKE